MLRRIAARSSRILEWPCLARDTSREKVPFLTPLNVAGLTHFGPVKAPDSELAVFCTVADFG